MLLVAHGSRDPRHAATVHALVRRVRAGRPDLRVEAGFLDFDRPSVPAMLESLAAEGAHDVVALPLLLTRGFHARIDIPALLRQAPPGLCVVRADVLAPSPLLLSALERRLYEAGLTPADKSSTGVVLASAGSTDPEAIAEVAHVARELRRTGWCSVRPAFASGPLPRPRDASRVLRAAGVPRVALAPLFLAPGRLLDRLRADARHCGVDVCADALGDTPETALLVCHRHASALGSRMSARDQPRLPESPQE
ncbi:MAG: sirohydrochlorin chelatase [Streptomyces sp.]|uniref:sirohydrochlorin chelatase n=1 Tax=Streptomyces sp. TaxID=1931 RepID=UPI0025DDC40D|nr:sirohydrochlorin chelatase [Streptomyces sp.]MBW8792644.1 sirohydrochlorin chelatase [Streptomyces sp.]